MKAIALLLLAAGCGSSAVSADSGAPDTSTGDPGDTSEDFPVIADAEPETATEDVPPEAAPELPQDMAVAVDSACNAVVAQQPDEGAAHITECSPTQYASNPPSSGNHYPVWPAYRVYDKPVPWGYLVHGLEHGAIIISYNCPQGCAADVARIQTFIDALPLDIPCGIVRMRIVLVPDPQLTVRFAASAWTWNLRADCFEEGVFRQFITDHYAKAPEAVCVGGVDHSAAGWCPPPDAMP